MSALKVGETAPDFELKNAAGEPMRLSDMLKQHQYQVLVFFPAAFSSVCTNEMNLYQDSLGELNALGANVVGVAVDNHYSLRAFAEQNGIEFPVLSDFQPRGQVASEYGVMGDDGMADRALFIVGPDRKIEYSYVSPRAVNPGVDKVLERLEELSAGRREVA